MAEIGRNDPCPCGSGLKYKKCCWGKKRFRSNSPKNFTDKISHSHAHRPLHHLLALFLIVLVSITAYSSSFQVPFVFDDGAHITNNRNIHLDDLSPHRIARLKNTFTQGRVVAELSFAFNYYFSKLDPFGYHLFNLIIHVLTAVAIYYLILITMTLRWPHAQQSIYKQIAYQVATAVSLIFAVHTVNTQAVTYIVQRMTSMAALFFIAALLAYIRGRLSHGIQRYSWYTACLLSFILALGSKQNTVTLPMFIVLYEIYFFQEINWQWLKKKWAILSGIFFGVIGFPILVAFHSTDGTLFSHLLKGYETRPFNMWERLLTQFRVIIYYFSLLFYPHPSRLNLDYEFSISRSLINPPTTLLCLIIILALLYLAFYLRNRRPLISFCILWFFGNLAIESTIYPLDLVYEHRLYLPSPAFFWILVILAIIGIERWISSKNGQKAVKMTCLVLVLGILTFWTQERNKVWHSVISILEDVVKKSPNNSRQHVNLGVAYSAIGEIDKGIEQYKMGIKLDPNYQQTYNNLGNAYNRKGLLDEAIVQYKKAIQMDPNYKEAHNNMGSAYYKKGMYDEAIKQHLMALKIQSDCEKSLNNLGVSYSAKGMYTEAIQAFQKAIYSKPNFDKSYTNLALAYTASKQPEKAIDVLEKAIRLVPNNPSNYYTLGNAYGDIGQNEKAAEAFQQAIKLKPNYASAHNNLGLAYRKLNNNEAAVSAYKKAISLNPRQPEFLYNLGLLYAQTNKPQEAIPYLQQSIALAPGFIQARFELARNWEALRQYQDAANEYESIIKITPSNGQAYYSLGQLYSKQLRDKNKARFNLQKALKLTNDANSIKMLKEQLRTLR